MLNALGLAGSPNLKLPTEYVEAVDRFVRANTKKKRRHSSSSSSEGKKSYKKKSPSDKGKELSMRRRDNHSSDSEEGESTKSSQRGKKSESSSKASQGSREKSRKETKGSKDADSDSSSSVASVDSAATTVVWGSETPLRSPMSIRFESPPPSLEQDEEAQEDAETQVQVFFYRRFFFVNCNVHFNI